MLKEKEKNGRGQNTIQAKIAVNVCWLSKILGKKKNAPEIKTGWLSKIQKKKVVRNLARKEELGWDLKILEVVCKESVDLRKKLSWCNFCP